MANVSVNDYKLMRARDGRMLGGVAAGLARACGLDVTLVRLCIGAMVLSGFGVPVYILMWIILPEESPKRGRLIEPAPEHTARIIRIALVALAALSLFNKVGGFWGFANPHPNHFGFDGGLGFILLGIGIAILFTRHRPDRNLWDASPPNARPAAPSAAPAGDEDPPPTFTGPFSEAMGSVHEAVSDAFREFHTTVTESRPRRRGEPPTPTYTTTYDHDDTEDRFDEFGNYNPYAGEEEPATRPLATATVSGDVRPSGGAALGWARVIGWLCLIWWTLSAVALVGLWLVGAVSVRSPLVLGAAGWLVFVAVLNTLLHAKFARAIIPSLALLVIPVGIAVASVTINGAVGYQEVRPTAVHGSVTERVAAGYMKLDLTKTKFDSSSSTVNARVGAGYLEVTVPNNAAVVVHATTKSGGGFDVFGRPSNGFSPDYTGTFKGCDTGPKLTLNLKAGAGFVQVQRANGHTGPTC
ncbi:MAG TPA: PspC domain-containing protein [Acidimicrobiales bacterium]|nr:PspC domain-containing protein [Acidimicrobiales bacterium]